MKILNLYAGIGGNRKLWGGEHQVTAIEYDENIAKAYQDRYPNDTVIVGCAKEFYLIIIKNMILFGYHHRVKLIQLLENVKQIVDQIRKVVARLFILI